MDVASFLDLSSPAAGAEPLRFECQERRTLQRERLTAPGEGEIPVKRLSRRAVSRSLLRGHAAPDTPRNSNASATACPPSVFVGTSGSTPVSRGRKVGTPASEARAAGSCGRLRTATKVPRERRLQPAPQLQAVQGRCNSLRATLGTLVFAAEKQLPAPLRRFLGVSRITG
jgi:hypothetical protein